ncbi:MAG: Jag N-terminal domain-containing protein [Clostridiales bacterium]|nr:Jag N-terminal domain-containing protein [Clostridiales bacterium]
MIKEFIGYGKTVEEATAAAKTGLNAPDTADINIEVISMPKKKVLGLFGGNDASVKAWFDDKRNETKKSAGKAAVKNTAKSPKAAPKKAPAKAAADRAQEAKTDKKPENTRRAGDAARTDITQSDIDETKAYLEAILKGLSIDDAVVSASVKDSVIMFDIECGEYGIIIGHRGETLDAIQYLTSISTKSSSAGYIRVIINVANYRERRAKTLSELALKNANYVQRTHRKYVFEPMNPYERRIIHTTVQEVDGVESFSIGTGADRKVIIVPEGGERRNNGQYGGAKRVQRPKAAAAPKADRADLPKFGKIERPAE